MKVHSIPLLQRAHDIVGSVRADNLAAESVRRILNTLASSTIDDDARVLRIYEVLVKQPEPHRAKVLALLTSILGEAEDQDEPDMASRTSP